MSDLVASLDRPAAAGVGTSAPVERAAAAPAHGAVLGRRTVRILVLLGLVVAAVVASLVVGAKAVPLGSVLDSLLDYDRSDPDQLIVRELRLPRTVVGLLVGASLGVAGALMQAVTRNPLADPGILGVNAGASFAVVLAIWLLDVTSVLGLVWFALLGAAVASVVVYGLGSIGRDGATPVRLALAGMALSMMLFALTRAVTLIDQATLDRFRFWVVGSMSGRGSQVAWQMSTFVLAGLVLAVVVSRPLNALGLGEDTARTLGTKVHATRAWCGVAIVLLCGAAVAAVGPIAFVGLVVPPAARWWFGADQRWLVPASALLGCILVVVSDTVGRVIAPPGEVQVGIMTVALGGPAFVLLVRRVRVVRL
jgi:iron complex transport system permease protein